MVRKEKLSDQELVNRARQGESAALGQLIQKYQRPVLTYLKRRAVNLQHAEDVLGEAVVRVVQKIDTLRDGQVFSNWFFQIAHNVLADDYRSSGKHSSFSLEALQEKFEDPEQNIGVHIRGGDLYHYAQAISDPGQNPETLILTGERDGLLRATVQALSSPDQKQVIALGFFKELSFSEIAAQMGCSQGAAKALAWRAKTNLRRTLEET